MLKKIKRNKTRKPLDIKIKVLLVAAVLIASGSVMYVYLSREWASAYCDEFYSHRDVGSTITQLHWHQCTPGYSVWIGVYAPDDYEMWYLQDMDGFPGDPGHTTYFYHDTASSPDHIMQTNMYLDEVGGWRSVWKIEGGGGVSGTGHPFHADPLDVHCTVESFSATPSIVYDGDTATVSFSVRNDGEVPVDLKMWLWNDKNMDDIIGSQEIKWLVHEVLLPVGNAYNTPVLFGVNNSLTASDGTTLPIYLMTRAKDAHPQGWGGGSYQHPPIEHEYISYITIGPSIQSFHASSLIVSDNETFTLDWTTDHVYDCDLYADDMYLGNYDANDTTEDLSIDNTTTFGLVANGAAGMKAYQNLTIIYDEPPPGPPDDGDGIVPAELFEGDNLNLIIIAVVIIIGIIAYAIYRKKKKEIT